jgi:Zn-dependent M28 family amino/carboxypeptidase
VRFVYDGDNSSFEVGPGVQPGPDGSGAIEQVVRGSFAARRLQVEATPFNVRSDYGPFIDAGIPAGGLFTGAEGEKTVEEAAVYAKATVRYEVTAVEYDVAIPDATFQYTPPAGGEVLADIRDLKAAVARDVKPAGAGGAPAPPPSPKQ